MAAVTALVMIGSLGTPATALETDSAEAEGRVVSGGGIVNLDGVVSLAPAYSADPSDPGVATNPLQVSVLDALGIDLGDGVQLFGPNGVIGVGALGQYASTSEESSYAAAGAVTDGGAIAVGGQGPQDNAFVDVTELLDTSQLSGITSGLISELRVELGALSATATSVADDLPTSDYQIADGTLVFTSPVVQDLTTDLNGVLTSLTATANGITGPTGALGQALPGLATGLVAPLTSGLGALTGGVVTVSGVQLAATLTVNLNTALSAITAAPLTSTNSAVTINFSTGEVSVDLARLIANSQGGLYDGTLNNLPANTQILDPSLIQAGLDGAVETILDQIPTLLVTTASNTLNSSAMTVRLTGNAGVNLGLGTVPLVNINVLASGTVGSFLGGSPAPVLDATQTTAFAILPVGVLLTPITNVVLGTLLPSIVGPLTSAVTGVGILDTAFRPLVVAAGTALTPVTGVINQILSITANVQEAGDFTTASAFDDGAFTQRAVSIDLLPLLGTPLAEVNLASATVRSAAVVAEEVAITAPLDGDVLTVPAPDATIALTVTGTGEVGADISVAAPGLPVQETVVGPDGTWTVTFPEAGVGTYAVVATQTAGGDVSIATVGVTVEVGDIDEVTITAPVDGTVVTVPVGGTTDTVVSGTGQIGAQVVVSVTGQQPQTLTVGPDGTWTATFPGLGAGTFTVTATQTVGDETSSESVTLVVDEIETVVLTAPLDGDVLTVAPGGSDDLVVTGTGDPGASVLVSVTGQTDQTVPVASGGTWTATFVGLEPGAYTVDATQTVGDQTTSASAEIEVVAVEPLTITSPPDGTVLNTPTGDGADLVVTGTGDIGAEVVASIPGLTDQTTTVEDDGTWTVTFSGLLAGDYTVTASQTVGDQASSDTVSVEVVEVDQVTVTSPLDGDVLTVGVGGAAELVVTGTGDAGASVVVTVTGQTDQTVPVALDGSWTATFPGLVGGTYDVTATQTVGDQVSSAELTVVVDEVVAVEITSPAEGTVYSVPLGGTTALVVSGTGDPGAEVLVSIPGQVDQTGTVGLDGSWTVSFPGLGIGTYDVTASQLVGDQATTSEVSVEVALGTIEQVAITSPVTGDVITVPEGGTTDLVVSGTGEIGGEVVVSIPGQAPQTSAVGLDGTWTVTFPGLGDGTYQVTATHTAEGQTNTDVVTVVVDGVVPVTVTAPVDGDVLTVPVGGSATLVVTGTGDPGAEVTVSVTGEDAQTVTVAPDGTWTATFPGLAPDEYEIVVTQTVGDQTTTETLTVVVDDVEAVTLDAPLDGDVIAIPAGETTDLVASGTGDPGAEVVVSVTGQADQTVPVTSGGEWTATFPGLGEGTYTVSVTQTVGDQTTSEAVTVEVDEVVQVTITTPVDGDVLAVAAGGTRDLVVSGAGDVGAEVLVTVTGQTDQTVVVGAGGTWTATFEQVGAGTYSVTASQTVNGQTSDATLVVDVEEFVAVSITAPVDGDVFSVVPGGTTDLVVEGAGEVGATVVVAVTGQVAQSVTVGSAGSWTATFEGLGDGDYVVSAAQTVGDQTTSASVEVEVETADVVAVTITAPVDGDVVGIPAGETLDLVVTGTGDPGAEVVVTIPGQTDQTATVEPGGTWTVTFPEVPAGTHEVTVTQTVGTDVTSETITVEVDGVEQVTIAAPADGDVLPVVGGGTRDLVVSGTGDPGAEVVVSVTGEDDQTVTVTPEGTWTATFPDLGDGTYVVDAVQTVSGQTSEASSTVELEAFVPVSIAAPTDGAIVTILPGDATELEVSGAGEPGATVVVTATGQEDQPTTVALDGTWTVTFAGLGSGTYEVAATQTVGDQTTTDEVSVEVDVLGVDPVTITSPVNGTVITVPAGGTADLVVTGTGDAGAQVVVRVTGQTDQTVPVGLDGTWTATFPGISEAVYDITATQTVGIDVTSGVVELEVDGVEPLAITSPADGDVYVVSASAGEDLVVMGTGDVGAEVVVSIAGYPVQTATVWLDGTWTVTFTGLGEGAYEVSASQLVGDQSSTDSVAFEVDTVEDVLITQPTDGEVLPVVEVEDTREVVVVGTGEVDADVLVEIDGQEPATAAVGADGSWTVTVPGLEVGTYVVTATQNVDDLVSTDAVEVSIDVDVDGAETDRPFATVRYATLWRGVGLVQEVYGSGFVPGESVSGEVRSTPFALAPVVADSEGMVTLSFPVDETFDLGAHSVYLTGSVSGPLADDELATGFVVMDLADIGVVPPGGNGVPPGAPVAPGAGAVPPPAAAGGGSALSSPTARASGGLARTGADDLGVGLLAGALLLLVGGGMVAVRRRATEG